MSQHSEHHIYFYLSLCIGHKCNITGSHDVCCHESTTSSAFQASASCFSSHGVVNENQWLPGKHEKHIKQSLTQQQQRDVWVEVNELKHAKTLKCSYKNTLRKHFTCKDLHFHDMHSHTHIYIVWCKCVCVNADGLSNTVWLILALSLWQKTIMTNQNCEYKRWQVFCVRVSVPSGAVRNSLFFVSRHWWRRGSTERGRCMSGETPAGPWTGTGRFSPGPSYVTQAEGKRTEREKMYEPYFINTFFLSNKMIYPNTQNKAIN